MFSAHVGCLFSKLKMEWPDSGDRRYAVQYFDLQNSRASQNNTLVSVPPLYREHLLL